MDDLKSQDDDIDYKGLEFQLDKLSGPRLHAAIVNAPFSNKIDGVKLYLGFICLYIVDEKSRTIRLMAVSGTEEYELSVENYHFKPKSFFLSLDSDTDNTIVQTIQSGNPQTTADWGTLSRKQSGPEVARLNQANSGIAYTAVYPYDSAVRGVVMYNFYQFPERVDQEQLAFMRHYTALVAESLDH